MKFKLKLLFGDPGAGQQEDLAYVDPVEPKIKEELKKNIGEEFISIKSDGKRGVLSLRFMKKILELYMIYSDSTRARLKAKEEWEEVEALIGVKRYLEYLENNGEISDLNKHLRKLAKADQQEAQHIWELLVKKEP